MEENQKGCVYFFRHLNTNPVKIGYSRYPTPSKRFEQFKTYAPFGSELLGFINAENAKELETELHIKYKSKRLKGEWFNISLEEVKENISFYSKNIDLINRSNFEIKYMNYIQTLNNKSNPQTNQLIADFMGDKNLNNLTIPRKILKDEFLEKFNLNGNNNYTAQKFNKYIQEYCEVKIIDLDVYKTKGTMCFVFNRKK